MLQMLLLATDFSARSDRALLRARLIARQTGAELTLAHVVDHDQPERLLAPALMEARSLLRDMANRLREEDGLDAKSIVIAADSSTGILKAAEEVGAELIVIGSSRKPALGTFPGRTLGQVLDSTTRPLLISLASPAAAYGRSVLALDFDEPSQAAAKAALALGIFDHMQVTVMHAFDPAAEGMTPLSMGAADEITADQADEQAAVAARLQGEVEALGLSPASTRAVTMVGSPARTILDTANSEGADLVILGTRQRKGFARALIGSVATDVIRESERDLLIVPVA